MPRRARIRPIDRTGLGIAAGFAAWTLISAAANDGSRPWPTLLAVVAATGAVAVGRAVRGSLRRTAGRELVALAALGGAIVAFVSVLDIRSAGGRPLGYGNANGALFAALAFGVVLVRVVAPSPSRRTRESAAVLGLVALGACVLTGSFAAVASAIGGAAVAAVGALLRRRWIAVPLATVVVVGTIGIVFAFALGAGPTDPGADSAGTRIALWRGAAEVAGDHALTGVGPGRFQIENPVSDDADLRRAHSSPLQTAAELGLPGLLLLFALGAWALAAIWLVSDDPASGVGAAMVTAVGVQSSLDWVLAEPAVLVVAALVLGAATATFAPPVSRLPRRLPGAPGSRLPPGAARASWRAPRR